MATPKELAREIQAQLPKDPEAAAGRLLDLTDPQAADVLNRLTKAAASQALARLPADRATRILGLHELHRRGALVEQLDPASAARLLEALPADERAAILRGVSPHECRLLLPKLSPATRAEAEQLLRYPDRTAGAIMTTEFVRLDPGMTVGQAFKHIRAVARDMETIYSCYVLEPQTGKLLGSVSLDELVMAEMGEPLTEVMRSNPISVPVTEDQESVARTIGRYNLLAVPVVEQDGRVVGLVTVDDVIDVLVEEQTEDVLKLGGVEGGALDMPYATTPVLSLVRRRATWLVILFLGEMLTATAMGFFEAEIARAAVLALFIPLVISSGGNSGSQATTLIIRALALREVTLWDWWLVMRREVLSGLLLGAVLGAIGFVRIAVWATVFGAYAGQPWPLIGLTVALSLVGIVMWGTLSGSMLPFVLKRVGLDPATSSAPFVATLVDVTGLVIYFSVAMLVLRGTLL